MTNETGKRWMVVDDNLEALETPFSIGALKAKLAGVDVPAANF